MSPDLFYKAAGVGVGCGGMLTLEVAFRLCKPEMDHVNAPTRWNKVQPVGLPSRTLS